MDRRVGSEVDLQRYNDISPTNQEKLDDRKKRGRSPFRFFSKKRGASSGDRTERKKSKTPDLEINGMSNSLSPPARSPQGGHSPGQANASPKLQRSPTIKNSQVIMMLTYYV